MDGNQGWKPSAYKKDGSCKLIELLDDDDLEEHSRGSHVRESPRQPEPSLQPIIKMGLNGGVISGTDAELLERFTLGEVHPGYNPKTSLTIELDSDSETSFTPSLSRSSFNRAIAKETCSVSLILGSGFQEANSKYMTRRPLIVPDTDAIRRFVTSHSVREDLTRKKDINRKRDESGDSYETQIRSDKPSGVDSGVTNKSYREIINTYRDNMATKYRKANVDTNPLHRGLDVLTNESTNIVTDTSHAGQFISIIRNISEPENSEDPFVTLTLPPVTKKGAWIVPHVFLKLMDLPTS